MLKLHTNVQVIDSGTYKYDLIGKEGTVENIMYDLPKNSKSIGVKIKGLTNKCSKKGLFWFSESQLSTPLIKRQLNRTKTSLFPYKQIVNIKFVDNWALKDIVSIISKDKEFTYYSYEELNINDLVLVKTAHNKLSVAKVIYIYGEDQDIYLRPVPGREVICKVDTSKYEYFESQKRTIQALKNKVKEYFNDINNIPISVFKAIMENDPNFSTIYKELINVFDNGRKN